jgi:hypothetical protein
MSMAGRLSQGIVPILISKKTPPFKFQSPRINIYKLSASEYLHCRASHNTVSDDFKPSVSPG